MLRCTYVIRCFKLMTYAPNVRGEYVFGKPGKYDHEVHRSDKGLIFVLLFLLSDHHSATENLVNIALLT